jgi:hypothetical protein
MKKVLNLIWDFFAVLGEYRYQMAKRRNFSGYY